MHGKRGSSPGFNYFDNDICYGTGDIRAGDMGLSIAHRSGKRNAKLYIFRSGRPFQNADNQNFEIKYNLFVRKGGTISFLVPVLAILNLPQWKCPSDAEMNQMTNDEKTEIWQLRMRELSGAIAVSASVQVFIGYTGLVGKLLKVITPLTIVPTVALVGLTLFEHAGETASKHWGIAVRYGFVSGVSVCRLSGHPEWLRLPNE